MAYRAKAKWFYDASFEKIESLEIVQGDHVDHEFVLINGKYHGRIADIKELSARLGDEVMLKLSRRKFGPKYWYAILG